MDQQYDLSAEELDKIRRRREIRERLRNEFNRKVYNPYKMVYKIDIMDPAVQRFMAAKVSRKDHWKPSWRSFSKWFGFQVLPVILFSVYMYKYRGELEYKIATGEITYEQRGRKIMNG